MTAAPSIAMISMLAMLSLFAATILRRPWQKIFALGCGIAEIVMLGVLLYVVRS